MERDPDGWARLVTDRARPGARYRYRTEGGRLLPDPASRFQPEDVHGRSEVVDPEAFGWTDDGWQGLPWEAMVFYELHVGAFTPEGTFRAAQDRLDYLADLGNDLAHHGGTRGRRRQAVVETTSCRRPPLCVESVA